MVAPTLISPVIQDSPAKHVLYQHFVVSMDELPETIKQSFTAQYARMEQAGIIPAGPPFVIYRTMAQPWDIDVCAPIAPPLTQTPGFDVKELPATRVVSMLHVGPYDTIGRAYDAVDGYIKNHSLIASGPPREIYLSPPDTPSEQIQTIVEWPIY
jgi:effector-binding domain-containing protein